MKSGVDKLGKQGFLWLPTSGGPEQVGYLNIHEEKICGDEGKVKEKRTTGES